MMRSFILHAIIFCAEVKARRRRGYHLFGRNNFPLQDPRMGSAGVAPSSSRYVAILFSVKHNSFTFVRLIIYPGSRCQLSKCGAEEEIIHVSSGNHRTLVTGCVISPKARGGIFTQPSSRCTAGLSVIS